MASHSNVSKRGKRWTSFRPSPPTTLSGRSKETPSSSLPVALLKLEDSLGQKGPREREREREGGRERERERERETERGEGKAEGKTEQVRARERERGW